MSHTFISYASQDASIANAVVGALEQAGQKCWLAPRDVTPGAQYADEIIGAINDASVVVVVLSGQSIVSAHVGKEIERASSKRRRIIALRTDATPLTRSLEYFLSESQWIDYRPQDAAAALAKLVNAVQAQGAHGAERVADGSPAKTGELARKSWAMIALVGVLGVALAGFVIDKFWLSRQVPAEKAAAAQSALPSAPAAALPATPVISEKSIAVLPFADLSERKDQEYFSDGLSEELIDLLTKVPDLHVPARASSFYFKGQHVTLAEIARALGVAYLLEGSVRKAGNKVRVSAELIRADNGYNVWSETYDRDLKDIFKVQDEISGRVVSALKAVLPSSGTANTDRTANTEAYNQYLLGRKFEREGLGEASLHQALDAFKKATTLDPAYVDAINWLAVVEAQLGDVTGDAALINLAFADVDRAVALGPRDPSGYVTRGWIRSQWRWDWQGARKDLDQAQALSSGFNRGLEFARADLAATEGRLDEAIAIQARNSEHDPLDPSEWETIVFYLVAAGRYTEAQAALDRINIIAPLTHVRAVQFDLDLLEGKPKDALADAAKLNTQFWQLRGAALAQHTLGHEHESQQALDEMIRIGASMAAYQIAEAYAWRGDRDKAFSWLERAYAQHDAGLSALKIDPLIVSLRADPRYRALLARLKLPL